MRSTLRAVTLTGTISGGTEPHTHARGKKRGPRRSARIDDGREPSTTRPLHLWSPYPGSRGARPRGQRLRAWACALGHLGNTLEFTSLSGTEVTLAVARYPQQLYGRCREECMVSVQGRGRAQVSESRATGCCASYCTLRICFIWALRAQRGAEYPPWSLVARWVLRTATGARRSDCAVCVLCQVMR